MADFDEYPDPNNNHDTYFNPKHRRDYPEHERRMRPTAYSLADLHNHPREFVEVKSYHEDRGGHRGVYIQAHVRHLGGAPDRRLRPDEIEPDRNPNRRRRLRQQRQRQPNRRVVRQPLRRQHANAHVDAREAEHHQNNDEEDNGGGGGDDWGGDDDDDHDGDEGYREPVPLQPHEQVVRYPRGHPNRRPPKYPRGHPNHVPKSVTAREAEQDEDDGMLSVSELGDGEKNDEEVVDDDDEEGHSEHNENNEDEENPMEPTIVPNFHRPSHGKYSSSIKQSSITDSRYPSSRKYTREERRINRDNRKATEEEPPGRLMSTQSSNVPFHPANVRNSRPSRTPHDPTQSFEIMNNLSTHVAALGPPS